MDPPVIIIIIVIIIIEGGIIYLITHSTHLIYIYLASGMVKDHSDSAKENLLPPLHGLLFLINNKGSVTCSIPQTG